MLLVHARNQNSDFINPAGPIVSLILGLERFKDDLYGGSSTIIARRRFILQLLQID